MAVSIHQATFNAMERHLSKHLGSDVIISRHWPSSDAILPAKMVTLVYAGPRRDIALDPRLLKSLDGVDPAITTTWQIRACEQPVQLDVWTRRDFDRDSIVANLDTILNMESGGVEVWNSNDIGNGTIVSVQDGWVDTFADFYFDSPETVDSSDSVLRSEYRTVYSGTCWFMLTVTKQNVKQNIIRLKTDLDGGGTYTNTDIT